MTDRSITLPAAQVRTVLLGLALHVDDSRRAFAVGVIADALLAVDEPTQAAVEPAVPAVGRTRAEQAVLDAARAWWGTGLSGPPTQRLVDAVHALHIEES